jgi:ubiquinone/menaquinone biosynthesis C-methylase UbiE
MTTTFEKPWGKTFTGSAPRNYERYFIPVIGGPLAKDLVARAELHAGERVLDVACGTGIVARLAAERVGPTGTVAGLDVNPEMLAIARSLAADITPAIRWYETTAESIPLPDDSFDAVFCQLGLQFIPDKSAAVREMRRVVAPEGRVLVNVPRPSPFFDVLEEAFIRHIPAGAPFVQMVFSMNDPKQIEQLFRGAGFSDVKVQIDPKEHSFPSPRDFLWQYIQCTPLTALVDGTDADALAALEEEVVSRWQPWVRAGGMSREHEDIVVVARK